MYNYTVKLTSLVTFHHLQIHLHTMSLESEFKHTADTLFKEINQTLSTEELKELYALFKQVGEEGGMEGVLQVTGE